MTQAQTTERLARLLGIGDDGDDGPSPLPEAQIATLREHFSRYAQDIAFKAGDIVTPRAGVNIKGAGDPHIVLETRQSEPDFSSSKPDTAFFGQRPDVRVMRVVGPPGNDDVLCFWVERWQIKPYAGAH